MGTVPLCVKRKRKYKSSSPEQSSLELVKKWLFQKLWKNYVLYLAQIQREVPWLSDWAIECSSGQLIENSAENGYFSYQEKLRAVKGEDCPQHFICLPQIQPFNDGTTLPFYYILIKNMKTYQIQELWMTLTLVSESQEFTFLNDLLLWSYQVLGQCQPTFFFSLFWSEERKKVLICWLRWSYMMS